MTNITGVRFATQGDEEAVFKLLCIAEEENALFPMSPHKVREFIKRATEKQGGIIGVIDGPNGIEASSGLVIEQAWYTDEWSIGERWNFVHPAHRQSTHVQKLILFTKWVTEQMNLTLDIGILSNKRTEAKIRLYKRHFEYMGAFFTYKAR